MCELTVAEKHAMSDSPEVGRWAGAPRPTVNERVRVLLVEDSALIRDRVSESLSELPGIAIVGYAESQAGALELMSVPGWDVAILDLQLKSGTGLGVLKALPADVRPPHTKIVVFTNYAFPQYRDRCAALGADFFVDKAREFDKLPKIMEGLVTSKFGGGSSEGGN